MTHIARPATRRLALQALEQSKHRASRFQAATPSGYRYCPAESLIEDEQIERRIRHIQSIGK